MKRQLIGIVKHHVGMRREDRALVVVLAGQQQHNVFGLVDPHVPWRGPLRQKPLAHGLGALLLVVGGGGDLCQAAQELKLLFFTLAGVGARKLNGLLVQGSSRPGKGSRGAPGESLVAV